MPGKTSSYSFLNVQASLDGLSVQGGWDGDDAITIEPGVDIGTGLVGADGGSIFSQTTDRSATITLKLMHTSPTHRQLMQKMEQQFAGRLLGFPLSIIETGSGEGGVTDQAFIMTHPGASYGKAATERDWVLWCGDWKPTIPNP